MKGLVGNGERTYILPLQATDLPYSHTNLRTYPPPSQFAQTYPSPPEHPPTYLFRARRMVDSGGGGGDGGGGGGGGGDAAQAAAVLY